MIPWFVALLASLAGPPASSEAFGVRVSPVVAMAPSDVTVKVFIERDDRNRAVEFIVESADYYPSSKKDLDGGRAPRILEVRFKDLPIGEYKIRVTLFGQGVDQVRNNVVSFVELR